MKMRRLTELREMAEKEAENLSQIMPVENRYYNVQEWLTPPVPTHGGDYYVDDYGEAKGLKTADTCQWFNSEPKFSKWLEKETGNALLWIRGLAGSGKTILATSMIDEIQSRKKNAPLLYFFCNSKGNDEHRCKAVAVIRSLLYQLW